jgi:hypothetical protein
LESLSDKGSRTGVVTASADMYFLQQRVALIPEDAPHEYVGSSTLVEFAVDEDRSLRSAGNALGLRLVGGELPFD